LKKGVPDTVKIELNKPCTASLKDQLFPSEWQALQSFKTNYEICKNYSDEFCMACLFARKLDLVRAHNLLQNNWKWRKENGFTVLPKLADFDLESFMQTYLVCIGGRAKDSSGIVFFNVGNMEMGKEPFVANTLMKWIAWYYCIGIFIDGVDVFRNGLTMIEDLSAYGWKQFDLDIQRKLASVWNDTFPVRIKKIYVLNPPYIFDAIMKILKAFYKAKIMERIECVNWKDLSKVYDKEVAPTFYEGTNATTPAESFKIVKEWAADNEERLRK